MRKHQLLDVYEGVASRAANLEMLSERRSRKLRGISLSPTTATEYAAFFQARLRFHEEFEALRTGPAKEELGPRLDAVTAADAKLTGRLEKSWISP